MWLLNFLPDALISWVVNLTILLGIAGIVVSSLVKYIPQVTAYRTIVVIGSVLLLVFGVYIKGGQAVEEKWRDRVRVAEEKVKIAEENAKKANEQVKEKIVEKIKVVKQKEYIIQEKIVESKEVIDAQCKVNAEVINILNEAAKKPEATK